MVEDSVILNPDIALPRCTLILAYHSICPRQSKYLYDASIGQFEQHLELFSSRAKSNLPIPSLTFDDGHRSCFEYAFPILEKFGIRATFFLVVGSIGVDPNYISWQQTREMAAAGHSFQSHGWSHRLLTTCNAEELNEELTRSREALQDRLGMEVNSLSIPGGRYDNRVIERSVAAGYRSLFHSNPWAEPQLTSNLLVRGRLMVTNRMTGGGLQAKMNSSSAQRSYYRAKYNLREVVRSMLGDRLYHRLWCWKANFDTALGTEVAIGGENETASRQDKRTGDSRT